MIWLFYRAFITVFVPFTFVTAYLLWDIVNDLPSYEHLKSYSPVQTTRIYSADLKLIEEYGTQRRVFVPISSIPEVVKNAFIAAEDRNFYKHSGIDFLGIARATILAVPRRIMGKRVIGGSTITQQVVKNVVLSSERTVDRKFREILLSLAISRKLSKEAILEIYLNHIYFGFGVYGISNAARKYFNKSVEDLNVPEAAFLAGLINAPSRCDPVKHSSRAKARRNYTLRNMYNNSFISEAELEDALASEILIKEPCSTAGINAPHYADKVQAMAVGLVGEETFFTGGLTIVTSLRSDCQKVAQSSLEEGLRKYALSSGAAKFPVAKISCVNWMQELKELSGRYSESVGVVLSPLHKGALKVGLLNGNIHSIQAESSIYSSLLKKLKLGDVIYVSSRPASCEIVCHPEFDGAVFAMHPVTGAVLAMSGGYSYSRSKFDRATQAKRQIGSTVKTFVYLSALENGIEPNDVYVDEPISIANGVGKAPWTPKNSTKTFLGPMTVRQAFEKSRNIVTIKIAQEIGLDRIIDTMKRLGINVDKAQRNLSLVLGAVEMSLMDLVSAYSGITNGGFAVTPKFIEYIQDKHGNVIYRNDDKNWGIKGQADLSSVLLKQRTDRAISEASAYQAISLLVGAATRGTACSFGSQFNQVVGGKTGTSNQGKDTWFVCFAKDIVAGCYVGYDAPKSLGPSAFGATVALPVLTPFMKAVLSGCPTEQMPLPSNLRVAEVDPVTGKEVETGDANSVKEVLKVGRVLPPKGVEKQDSSKELPASLMPTADGVGEDDLDALVGQED